MAPVLERPVGLGVPGVDLAGAAGHPEEDDRLVPRGGPARRGRPGPASEEVGQAQSRHSRQPGLEHVPATRDDQALALPRVQAGKGVRVEMLGSAAVAHRGALVVGPGKRRRLAPWLPTGRNTGSLTDDRTANPPGRPGRICRRSARPGKARRFLLKPGPGQSRYLDVLSGSTDQRPLRVARRATRRHRRQPVPKARQVYTPARSANYRLQHRRLAARASSTVGSSSRRRYASWPVNSRSRQRCWRRSFSFRRRPPLESMTPSLCESCGRMREIISGKGSLDSCSVSFHGWMSDSRNTRDSLSGSATVTSIASPS